jgi:hypothetical protein
MRRLLTAALGLAVLAGGVAVTSVAEAAPGAEHIPASVDRARIYYSNTQDPSQDQRIALHGRRAQHLVALFDALKREPQGTAECDLATSSETTVTFRGTKHTWVATEEVCRNISVQRDGQSQPKLLPSKAWNAALTHYLGHSPVSPAASPAG